MLARLEGQGFRATREDGHLIALARNGDRITMEPGGQLELSGGALLTATDCAAALDAHVREVAESPDRWEFTSSAPGPARSARSQ